MPPRRVEPGPGPVVAEPAGEVMPAAPRRISFWLRLLSGTVQLGVVIALIAGGYVAYSMILDSAPTAQRKPHKRVARLVEVATATPATAGPVIEAWGKVTAARTLVVRPEVAGTVLWVHPELTPGGFVPAGTVVAMLDDRDLKLAVARAETEIARIDARIQIERGQAAIGERELSRLDRNLTEEQRALVLRKPQMAQLMAERAAAVAVRDEAQNAVERAEVVAPYSALVLSENVSPGAMLTQGTEAARLVAADRFHVELAVPASSLGWLRFDGTQEVRLVQEGAWLDGVHRTGRIVRLGSTLSETGRMAEVIVEVEDPLVKRAANAGKPPLLLGSFVRGTIAAPPIEGAVMVDRAHLRDGDTLWVMNAQDQLEVRQLDIAWRGPDQVLVTGGLAPGDRIVATRLATFAPGMALRTRGGASE